MARFVALEHKDPDIQATVARLWQSALPNIPQLFADLEEIRPSLLHGDLWPGNAAEIDEPSEDEQPVPVVFDPACFYGHHEFDLAVSAFFVSSQFGPEFNEAYHELIPKAKGFEKRQALYKLVNRIIHTNVDIVLWLFFHDVFQYYFIAFSKIFFCKVIGDVAFRDCFLLLYNFVFIIS